MASPSIREFFLQRFEAEYPATMRVLHALPVAKLDWRPHARSRSAGELVALLVYELQTGIELCQTGQLNWDESAAREGPLEEMTTMYERRYRALLEQIQRMDDATWERKAKFLVRGMPILEEPTAELFWTALFDPVHHRGQLTTYIRPMGGKVPSIYGPSGDSQG